MVSSNLKRGKADNPAHDELRLVDAVLAAFCFQSGRKEQRPRRLRIESVYRAFAKLREKDSSWLQDMSFTYGPAGTVPVSGVLEDILFDLGARRIMSIFNPWYDYLSVSAAKLKVIRGAISERRNETELDELRHLADEFARLYSEALKKV